MFQIKNNKKHNSYWGLIFPTIILLTIVLLVKSTSHSYRESLPASEVDITKHVNKPVKHKPKRKLHYLVIDNINCNLTDSPVKVTQTTYRNGKKVQTLNNNDNSKVMSVDVKATTNIPMNGIERQEVHN